MNIVDLLLGRLMRKQGGGSSSDLPVLTTPASAADIRAGKETLNGAGQRMIGSMPDHAAVVITLDTGTTEYIPPKGYHDGESWIGIELEEKTVELTESTQEVTPEPGKVLSKVIVPGVVEPTNYVLVTPAGVEISATRVD